MYIYILFLIIKLFYKKYNFLLYRFITIEVDNKNTQVWAYTIKKKSKIKVQVIIYVVYKFSWITVKLYVFIYEKYIFQLEKSKKNFSTKEKKKLFSEDINSNYDYHIMTLYCNSCSKL